MAGTARAQEQVLELVTLAEWRLTPFANGLRAGGDNPTHWGGLVDTISALQEAMNLMRELAATAVAVTRDSRSEGVITAFNKVAAVTGASPQVQFTIGQGGATDSEISVVDIGPQDLEALHSLKLIEEGRREPVRGRLQSRQFYRLTPLGLCLAENLLTDNKGTPG
jgi:hypothetical protein